MLTAEPQFIVIDSEYDEFVLLGPGSESYTASRLVDQHRGDFKVWAVTAQLGDIREFGGQAVVRVREYIKQEYR